jgi:hypothetical protein
MNASLVKYCASWSRHGSGLQAVRLPGPVLPRCKTGKALETSKGYTYGILIVKVKRKVMGEVYTGSTFHAT